MRKMREMLIGSSAASTEEMKTITCEYYILVRELEEGIRGESYGIRIKLLEEDASIEIPDITSSAARVEALAELLQRNFVTPCTLREVLEDWL